MKPDYTLYLVTDRRFKPENEFISTIESAIQGGVSIVQLREKDISSREFYNLAVGVKTVCDKYDVPLIINDRLDIALAVDAAGVHVGQSDLPVDAVIRILGDKKIVGLSVSNASDVKAALNYRVDYLGLSPVFSTDTKTDTAKPLGLDGISELRKMTDIPLVAIGGISTENAADIISVGADGLAVVSAIMAAENPKDVSQIFQSKIEIGFERRVV
jgi:thiamine-phosphate pyrophosphorylase